ncbi:MAG: MoxR family ATPase [Ruminococcaceae bacterium]|nr:MoxR family ATPase [Oscillospiraceae bacterium]
MSPEMLEIKESIGKLIDEVEKAVIGKHNEIVMLVSAMLAGGHVLIEDVPGVGKTTLAAAIAKAAGLDFRRAQFTPDVMASDITGFNIYNRTKETFEFREGLVMCNIFLADEINRASPKTQSALLEAMEEGKVTVDGVTYEIPAPFTVIATQNPAGYVGTYPLPEAQMDRFALRLSMGYPSEDEELSIILDRKTENPLNKLSAVIDKAGLARAKDAVSKVEMSAEISRYIVKLVGVTRNSELISLGASPRATLALMKVSKAFAFLRGRDYVTPEDVMAVYKPVVAHRIVLGQEARLSRMGIDEVLDRVVREVEVPYKTSRI